MTQKFGFTDHTKNWKRYLEETKKLTITTTKTTTTTVTSTRSRSKSPGRLVAGDMNIIKALRDVRTQLLNGYPYEKIRSQVGMLARGINTSQLKNADTKFYISSFKSKDEKKQEQLLTEAFPASS